MDSGNSGEWFEDEEFWAETYPFMFPESRFVATHDEAEQLLKLAAADRPRDILDLCCGPGRFSLELARRGFQVTGVDRTEFLLEKARRAAEAERLAIEWVRSDMREFVRPDAFDLAISMFTSFGYFEDQGEDLRVLQNLHTSLRPGGRLILDIFGKEILARAFRDSSAEVLNDGSMLVERREIVDSWTRIRNEWTVVQNGQARTFRFQHSLYSAQELQTLLERAGFGPAAVYGDLSGAPYNASAKRLILLAHKEG